MSTICDFGLLDSFGYIEHVLDRTRKPVDIQPIGPVTSIEYRNTTIDGDALDGLAHPQILYIDPVNGSDANDGLTAATAVQTLDYAIVFILTGVRHTIHFVTAAGGFVDAFITMNGGVLGALNNLRTIQCDLAVAANIELRDAVGVNPQIPCENLDNIRLTTEPKAFTGQYNSEAASVLLITNQRSTIIRHCEIISPAYAVNIFTQAGNHESLIEKSILRCGLQDRVQKKFGNNVWGWGEGSIDVPVDIFDERYTGCVFVPAGIEKLNLEYVAMFGTGVGGSVVVGARDILMHHFENVITHRWCSLRDFQAVLRSGKAGIDYDAPGNPDVTSCTASILDNIGQYESQDPSFIVPATGTIAINDTILNIASSDPLSVVQEITCLRDVPIRWWADGDHRLQHKGVEFAEGQVFGLTSPGIKFLSGLANAGAWQSEFSQIPYQGDRARFVQGMTGKANLTQIRNNFQDWSDILGNYKAVWDSVNWGLGIDLSAKYFAGTAHSAEWLNLLSSREGKRFWPGGINGFYQTKPLSITSTSIVTGDPDLTIGVLYPRLLDPNFHRGWVSKIGNLAGAWDEPPENQMLDQQFVRFWKGVWFLDDTFGVAVGEERAMIWNGYDWIEMGNEPNAGDGSRPVWGIAKDYVWCAQADGHILRWNGYKWIDHGVVAAVALRCIWAFDTHTAYAGAADGRLYSWDGSDWSQVVIANTDSIISIWGSSPADVWFAGDSGALWHFDGTSWSDVSTPSFTGAIRCIFGISHDSIWLCMSDKVYYWDGSVWALVFSHPDENKLVELWADKYGRVWVLSDHTNLPDNGSVWFHDGTPEGTWVKEVPFGSTSINRQNLIFGTEYAVYCLGSDAELQVLRRRIHYEGYYQIESNNSRSYILRHIFGPDLLALADGDASQVGLFSLLFLPVELDGSSRSAISELYEDGVDLPFLKLSAESESSEFHSRKLSLKETEEVVY